MVYISVGRLRLKNFLGLAYQPIKIKHSNFGELRWKEDPKQECVSYGMPESI